MSDIQNSENPEASESLLESRYSQVQHLQAIGTLAGGIAHDFNNILFGIQGYAELALAEAPEGSIQADNLNEILNGCHRAKELVHQILTFSRQDNGQKIPVSLPPLIKEALKLLRAGIPSSIDIQTRFAPDLPRVDAPEVAHPTHGDPVLLRVATALAYEHLGVEPSQGPQPSLTEF